MESTTGERAVTGADVAMIFRELLGATDELSPDINFFEAGGDSLLAARVVARLRTRFEVKVAIRDLFNSPTPAGLAEAIAGNQGSAGPR